MLSIYPRHVEQCEAKLIAKALSATERRSWKRCGCPLWIIGMDPRGTYHRKSLQTTSWEVATSLLRQMELGVEEKPRVEIAVALAKWKSALLAAKRKPRTVAQVHGVMAKSLDEWAQEVGYVYLDQLTLETLNDWVGAWKLASTTHRARIDLARQFWRFAVAHRWVPENVAKGLLKPKEDREPTLPFTAHEEQRIFEAARRLGERRSKRGLWIANPETAYALMLVMRWTGLRASDAVLFEPRHIKTVEVDGKLHSVYETYQTKTGEWVMCPLPSAIADLIAAAPRLCEAHAFMPPEGGRHKTDTHTVTCGFHQNWLRHVGRLAGVEGVHPHRFRDTFAVRLLEAGKPLEIVQALLGHSSIKTTEQHYAPWVKSRQHMLIREVMGTWMR